MNAPTIIVLALVLLALAWAVRGQVKGKNHCRACRDCTANCSCKERKGDAPRGKRS